MSLTAGSRIGLYEIVSAIGAGGMGEVYRARDTALGRDVALKCLPESFTHDEERVARFRREAQVLASLNHPHIGSIYGLEQADGQQLLVLELVDGETLADRLASGSGLQALGTAQSQQPKAHGLPLEEALGIARQIAEALESAHEKGIIHRDLKPANVALTSNDQVKVLDFGLAKALEPEASAAAPSNSPTLSLAATRAGVILGTAAPSRPGGRRPTSAATSGPSAVSFTKCSPEDEPSRAMTCRTRWPRCCVVSPRGTRFRMMYPRPSDRS